MRTVDTWGNWTPFGTLDEYRQVKEDELCFMDKIAIAVLKYCESNNYTIKTSLTTVSDNIYLAIESIKDYDNEWEEYSKGFSEQQAIENYLYDYGICEYDYE